MLLGIVHSAKGSTWEEHKYLKRIDGTYYYPENYEGGRHLSDLEDSKKDEEKEKEEKETDTEDENKDSEEREKLDLTEEDIENLANEVIRGNFGNGQERKDLLGENYQEIQDRVNQIVKSKKGTTKIKEVSEKEVEEGTKAITKAVKAVSSKGIDIEQVFSVYRKKKN